MQCSDSRLLIHAYLDNELGAGDSVRLNRHIADCPACARELEHQSLLQDALRRAKPTFASGDALPGALRARVLASLQMATPGQAAAMPSSVRSLAYPLRQHGWHAVPIALAAGVLLLLGGGAGIAWQRRASDVAALAADVVSDHLRSLQPQHLTDVLTSDRHTVKPWFDGKLDFSPQVRDLDAAGFVLVGGRLDVLHGRRVAAVVYRLRQHPINLFQWPDAAADSTPISADAGDGYTVTRWTQDGMAAQAATIVETCEMRARMHPFRRDPASTPPNTPFHLVSSA